MHDGDRIPERVVDGAIARVQDDGVGRRLERVHLCVLRVAAEQRLLDLVRVRDPSLFRASLAPLIRLGDQEQFEGGVREDDRPDVSTLDHRARKAERVHEQAAVVRACNEKKLDVQRVLEFFGQEAVARVVRDSPKLIDPSQPPQNTP